MDLSALDQPAILEVIFPLVYSPFYSTAYSVALPDIPGHFIEVEEGVKIHCGFWLKDKGFPTILYFHGNGETVADYHSMAPFYNDRGINLFVADYRGYGLSSGKPTVSNLINDAHLVFESFQKIIGQERCSQSLFIMGRSLGSMPALEVALNYQDDIRGLIIESGAANNLRRLWEYLDIAEQGVLDENSPFLNKVKIRQVAKPTLIIHGEYDEIIPVNEAEELYRNSAARDKKLLIIRGTGHNDLLAAGHKMYFEAIEKFIEAHG
ncbi:MAG: alpha/beta fold hydrolase [Chloroflexota bacterium]